MRCPFCWTPYNEQERLKYFPFCSHWCRLNGLKCAMTPDDDDLELRNKARKATLSRSDTLDELYLSEVNLENPMYDGVENHGKACSLDVDMSKAIRDAAVHCRDVCAREHIKATDRHERVGLFVTSLRHRCSLYTDRNLNRYLSKNICNKAIWYDAGILDKPLAQKLVPTCDVGCYGNMNLDRLKRWIMVAKIVPLETEEAEIDALITEAKTDLAELRQLDTILDDNATQSERLAEELTVLLAD